MQVTQRGEGSGFALESLSKLRVAGEVRGEHLDRHRPIQPHVSGFVNLAHATRAESGEDFIRADSGARNESQEPDYRQIGTTNKGKRRRGRCAPLIS